MPDKQGRGNVVVPVVIAAIAAVVAVAMFVVPTMGSGPEDESEETAEGATSNESGSAQGEFDLARRQPGDPMAKGDVDAPVVMVAYSEFQCPFCGKFARDVEPRLIDEYVANGTLRIEWRDFPYLGQESTVAARGGRAAAEQDKFWAFHDAMFADQLPPNSGNLDRDHLRGVADEAGLDVDQFEADLDAAGIDQPVQADFREGQQIGVTGTPTFVINGRAVVGAQPVEVFEQVIEEAAAESAGQ